MSEVKSVYSLISKLTINYIILMKTIHSSFIQGLAVASCTSEICSVLLVNRATCLVRSGTYLSDASRDLALAESLHTYPPATLYKLHLQKSECARLRGLDDDAIQCMHV